MQSNNDFLGWVAAVAFCAILGSTNPALAVPSFARQTGMACEACHTVFPELTHFGRMFKANGYILDNVKQVQDVSSKKEQLLELASIPPLSIMLQVSYTQLRQSVPDQANVDVPGKAQNGTVGFPQQFSLFYAGKIAPHVGAFIQATYDNAGGTFGIDNTDLRFADMMILPDDHSLVYGISLNNNPTVQDLWNSTPAFGFPYAASNAVVSPLAATQIDGSLAQEIAGLTAYAFWNESVYAEVGGYRSAKQGVTNSVTGAAGPLDGTTSNVISGVAPYWRIAYEHNWGAHSIEAGLYGLDVKLLPGASSSGPSPLQSPYNRFKDVAEDLQYQYVGDEHIVTVQATRIHERMDLAGSLAVGATANPSNQLTTTRFWTTYYYRRRVGATAQYFQTTGSSDPILYPAPAPGANGVITGVVTSANGSPGTRGWVAEANYLPWLNTKLTLQYTAYTKFNGSSANYDGLGRSASANNALYLLLWFSY